MWGGLEKDSIKGERYVRSFKVFCESEKVYEFSQ